MMMVLGLYVFMLRTVPYQELQYQRSWRHAANSRVNRRPSTQFLGPDNDMLTLSGVLMPEITGGRLSLLALEQMAEQGKAWPLIEGSGTIYGMYVIAGLNQTKTEFSATVCRAGLSSLCRSNGWMNPCPICSVISVRN